MLYLASRTTREQVLARIGFALIVGGALGNLIDRAVHGHVIDYILFHTPVWSFAVFNLADAFITVGAVLVVADELFGWWRQRAGEAFAARLTLPGHRRKVATTFERMEPEEKCPTRFKAILISRDAEKSSRSPSPN